MKHPRLILLSLGIIGTLTACAGTPPSYLGKSIDPTWPGMCMLEEDLKTPTSCRVTLKDFEFMFDVERVQGTEYRIHGKAIPLIADTSRQIRTGGFIFFLTNQGIVVDSVTILAAQTRVDTSQSLLIRFETQEAFDAITVGYEVSSGRSGKGAKGPTAWSIPPTLLE
jgi:hypothetical protein